MAHHVRSIVSFDRGSSPTLRLFAPWARVLTMLMGVVGLLVAVNASAEPPAVPKVRVRQPGPFVVAPRPVAPAATGAIGTVVVVEKKLSARLQRAKEYLEQGKFTEALPVVQQILDDPADTFLPDAADATKFVSLKATLGRWLSELPEAGRDSYALQFGETAKQALADGEGRWAETVVRYPISDAGGDASWRLATRLFDRGRAAEAVRLLERLRENAGQRRRFEPALTVRLAAMTFRTGDAKRANALLEEAAVAAPGAKIELGERPYDHSPESRAWLARRFAPRVGPIVSNEPGWMSLGGGSERRSLVFASVPAGNGEDPAAWPKGGVPVVTDPLKTPTDSAESTVDALLRATVGLLVDRTEKDRRQWWPRFQPVIVGDLAVVRTLGNVRALRLDGGGRAWETLADDHLERLLVRDEESPRTSPSFKNYVDQRMWDDATAARLSSDGRFVFAVEDSGPARPIDDARERRQSPPTEWNRLAAYEATTGRLFWELGGPADESGPAEAGAFFLGAPLVDGDRLYLLSEKSGTIRLHELDANDGRVLWTQPLAEVDSLWSVARNPSRRLAGLVPSLADGLLVCPTGVGLVVAVDLIGRRLAWVHDVPQSTADADFVGATPAPTDTSKDTGWVDGTPVLTGGIVLLPRAGGHPLYGVSLKDGARRWSLYSRKLPSNARWLAVDAAGRMLVVGERSAQSYEITGDEPRPRWAKATSIPTPCGTGFIADGVLHFPARETKVGRVRGLLARLDVDTGEPLESIEVLEDRAPGNLVLASGLIVSQSVDRIDLFPLPPKDKPAGR